MQVSVAVNNWYGPFWDYIPGRHVDDGDVEQPRILSPGLASFAWLALVGMSVSVLNAFLVSHWVFRWRMAMNEYYMSNWNRLRHIEGASQRVQEDTMRFSQIMEGLGVSFVDSIMTLIAFMPVLAQPVDPHNRDCRSSAPFPHPLVVAALAWSAFGTVSLRHCRFQAAGPAIQNQRVEAAYRKELVYGEDNAARAQPATVVELFDNVRRNYFRLYFHYVYFNVVRYSYLQANNIFSLLILGPSIVGRHDHARHMLNRSATPSAGHQSFQYLVNSWPTIVELSSIHKRLRAFEATLEGEPLPEIDKHYLERAAREGEKAALAE